MNTRLLLVLVIICTMGCNVNPSKEARLQKLEMEMEQTIEQVKQLEIRLQALEKQVPGNN